MNPDYKQLLDDVKQYSDNTNTKTAALLLRGGIAFAAGTNRLPKGVTAHPLRLVRPAYYDWLCHAERDVIFMCARDGIRTLGTTMVMEWFPCADCARAIIMAGIAELHCDQPDLEHPRWGRDFQVSLAMLNESEVKIVWNEVTS